MVHKKKTSTNDQHFILPKKQNLSLGGQPKKSIIINYQGLVNPKTDLSLGEELLYKWSQFDQMVIRIFQGAFYIIL